MEHPVRNYASFEDARQQAAQYLGFVTSFRIEAGGLTFEIPNPSLLDEEQQDAVDALDIDMDENWDRHPDVLNEDGSVRVRGPLKVPHRKNGKPVNYNRELARAVFGDEYDAFKNAGGRPNDVGLIWTQMNRELAERRVVDSKSGGSTSTVEAAASDDRGGSADSLPAQDS